MAGVNYNHPNCMVRREHPTGMIGGTASIDYGVNIMKQARRLKALHLKVLIAGSTAVNALTVKLGTTSIAAAAFGTATALTQTTILFGTGSNPKGIEVPSLSELRLTNATDVTFRAVGSWEFEVLPSAEFTD